MALSRKTASWDMVKNSGFRICYDCKEKYYAMTSGCLRCPECRKKRTEYHSKYYHRVIKVKAMDKKIKTAQKHIDDKLKGAQNVEKKEFKGLLKEDHKLDAKRESLEKQVKAGKKSK